MTIPTKGPRSNTPNAESLANAAQTAAKKGPPPVHLWDPPFCGDLDMRIARDGTWFYLGSPIGRKPLVKLFSSILRKDDDNYFLVTPVEKVGITVDDAPFVAVDFDMIEAEGGAQLRFTTHVDDVVIASAAHPIRFEFDEKTGEPSPYILIRDNLEALIDRKCFYRLVDIGEHKEADGENWFGVKSNGVFFKILRSTDLE